ncbi:UDP-N-acetyl-D-glucosamine 6-dehydrogenase [Candidatus Brocadiaceae bacterium B188]|nr:nucleotide sugar dehydrogenase [Candidatus Brocadia sapporoensis]QQR65581.1 MAG: nucleotide sugar dehydrogenase [Candidatus Brocadia sp.]RZV59920.1 MAG: nucleotide sugar dehydrogenase [Candidatus Brocadia sp. BROELEC01]TWU49882.1 UDP-N-acetyl-D-glucosamine 6-dehydrogenase [Candidatus Brocadiaceae bacterium B188]
MDIIEKIKSKKAHIGIIGLGYVGLPLVTEFCKAGFQVAGFDIDERKVELLKQGKSYIKHIDGSQFSLYGQRFSPTSDFSRLADMDCIIICVPTPLNKNREPDMTYVFHTTRIIAQNLRKGQLIVLESTTYPGTTDEDMRSILEEKGLKAGADFHLAFSPEREDPNRKDFSTSTIPKIVSGYTEACLAATKALYDSVVVKTVTVSSTKVAEATKLLENIYRAVNIALVNELKMLFDKMGIDVWEVIEAAKTKPFGFQAFYPGPGLGGHCIPIDPFYLTWKAREYEFSTRFIELAGEINTNMPHYVIQKTIEALNERGKSLKGSKILILGLAYKKDVDDLRESPSLKLIELLLQKGAEVDYNDPYIPRPPAMRKYKLEKHSVALTEENLAKYDAVVIATEHSDYNPEFILKNAELIVDTRNFIKNHTNHSDKVKRA